jgi:D-alanine transaminase
MAAPLTYAHLNGHVLPVAEARVSALDRGFLFGDGAYEVVPVYAGRPFRLAERLSRLARSLRELRIVDPHDPPAWRALIDALISSNGGGQMTVYLQVTRGAELARDHAFPRAAAPTVFATCFEWSGPSETQLAEGVAVITETDVRWGRCDIKSLNLLPNVLARERAVEAGVHETLFVRDGFALEGASSTLLIVEDGAVVTPPDGPQILPGTTRNLLRDIAGDLSVPWRSEPVTTARLRAASEVWLASTTREVLAVTRLDGSPVGDGRPGPVWRRMHEALRARVERFVAGTDAGAGAPLQFPCTLPLKIIVLSKPGLRERILALIGEHAAVEHESVRERTSGGARYLAVSVTVQIADREALDALYGALRASDDVVWAL